MRMFLRQGSDFDALGSVLGDMQTLALPALVEALAGSRLMPPSVRRRDAVFISAFQDIVLEYCEEKPTDIASFSDLVGAKEGVGFHLVARRH